MSAKPLIQPKDPRFNLASFLLATAGCLVFGYLFGRGVAGESSSYAWGIPVGLAIGLVVCLWYWSESLTYTGALNDDQMFGLPVSGPAVFAMGATVGGWLQAHQWVFFAVVTAALLVFGIWGSTRERRRRNRRQAELEWFQDLLSRGCRAAAHVTEAVLTGERITREGQTDVPRQVRFTVQFADSTGVQHEVAKKAYFYLARTPGTGCAATVLYASSNLEPDKVIVVLEPPHNVELRLRHVASEPLAARSLAMDDGTQVDLWASSVLVARTSTGVEPDPGTQLVVIDESGISTPHARLDLIDGTWQVTNTDTFSSVAVTNAGELSRLRPGESAPAGEHLRLGPVGMRLLPHSTLGHTQEAPELSALCTSHDGRAWFM
ncbi:MAG: hypothetical protein FWF02_01835 [Micrococcales bacterium]|nr:hypothetical protein [Micrococcales bacterium]MCL2666431.1 hypothetical protein [Micrococcales bacterium]